MVQWRKLLLRSLNNMVNTIHFDVAVEKKT